MRELNERQRNLNGQDIARLNQHRAGRPNMRSLPEAVDEMAQGSMPHTFYDHVHDRVYVLILREDLTPSGQYRALDAIDPDPANRGYITVED